MEETVFVYVNLNSYPVVVNGPFGGPIAISRNKAVKGDYFARFAQPSGSLSMVNEKLVSPAAVVFEAKPLNDTVAASWAKQKSDVDPILTTSVPPSLMPAVGDVVTVMTDEGEEGEDDMKVTAVDGENVHVDRVSTDAVEDITVPAKKTRKKK